jgi:hypothetical protein
MIIKIKKILIKLKKYNHNFKSIKKISISGMISLELVFVLGIMVTIVSKIISSTYKWVNKFYILNKILIIVNGYCQFNMPSNEKFNNIIINTEEKKLKIYTENKDLLNEINEFLKDKINNENNYSLEKKQNEIYINNNNYED